MDKTKSRQSLTCQIWRYSRISGNWNLDETEIPNLPNLKMLQATEMLVDQTEVKLNIPPNHKPFELSCFTQ